MSAKNLLKERRLAAGMTQCRLAKAAGCTEQMIYMIERQMRLPRVDLAVRITTALGCPVEAVFPSVEVATDAQG